MKWLLRDLDEQSIEHSQFLVSSVIVFPGFGRNYPLINSLNMQVFLRNVIGTLFQKTLIYMGTMHWQKFKEYC